MPGPLPVSDVVLSLRDRMRVLSTTPGKLTPVTDNQPIRLHKNAVSEFYGVLTLPGPAGAALKESAPAPTKDLLRSHVVHSGEAERSAGLG